VLTGVERAFGATSSWIMLHDASTNVLRTCQFRGYGADVYGSAEIPADRGVAGLVFTHRRIEFVPDASGDDRWFDPERVRASALSSVFVLPLVIGDRTIGVLGLDCPAFRVEHAPTPLDIKRLEIFAAQAAIGLFNARLYQESQEDRARLRALLRERRALRQQVVELRDEVRAAHSYGAIIGESVPIRSVLVELEQVAASDATVLLLGETGTGKELLARALHERGHRSARSFVPVNCAALPENLVESELFGHERGAFTGAHTRKPGRFELAHRGTLFLDEIGDLPANAQAKLLRVLQDGEVYRVGSTRPAKVDVRVVAATNQDLAARVSENVFRADLFYRLNVFPIRVPPLRERAADIPLLARHLTVQCAKRLSKRVTAITEDAIDALTSYGWPGNVRELQNVIERAVILTANGIVTADTIRLDHASATRNPPAPSLVATRPLASEPSAETGGHTLADAERMAIVDALRRTDGRVSGPTGAAARLGLKPTTLHAKMKKLGVSRHDAFKI
jgi:formate hydrogenlyase transcriptional activator